MNNSLRVSLVLVLLLQLANGLFFPISSKPFCINIDDEPGKQFIFSYEVSGNNPDAIRVDFEPEDNSQRRFSLNGKKNQARFDNTNMKICFLSTDSTYKSVSFDFYTHDTAHLKELAVKSQIYDLHAKLIEVGEKLKDISRNQLFEEEKQSIHADIIVNHEWRLQMFAILKLAIILIVVGAQLYLLKALLNKSQKGYNPV